MGQEPSSSAQVMITIIPIVGIVVGGIVIFFYLLWNHKQKMKLMEKGLYEKTRFDVEAFSLLMGLLSTGVGSVLFLFFLLKEGNSYSLLGGLIPLSLGISFLAFYKIRVGNLQ